MRMNPAGGTGHSQPAESQRKWTPTCRTRGGDGPWTLCAAYSLCTALPGDSSVPVSGLWTKCSLCGESFYFPALGTPHADPYTLRWMYTHKSLVQAFQLQGFQTTITLSSQPAQINCCRLRAWVFVKFKQIRRARELCSIAALWQPAPSSSPGQSDVLMGLLAHQLPSRRLRRCRSSGSLIQTRFWFYSSGIRRFCLPQTWLQFYLISINSTRNLWQCFATFCSGGQAKTQGQCYIRASERCFCGLFAPESLSGLLPRCFILFCISVLAFELSFPGASPHFLLVSTSILSLNHTGLCSLSFACGKSGIFIKSRLFHSGGTFTGKSPYRQPPLTQQYI